MVVKIPFNCEVKVKAVCVAGQPEGFAPNKMKVYKNIEAVDYSILEDKKPIQVFDLAENILADIDCALNVSKFESCSNIVLGFEGSFGADTTQINFIGIKGQMIRAKQQTMGDCKVELVPNLADHKSVRE